MEPKDFLGLVREMNLDLRAALLVYESRHLVDVGRKLRIMSENRLSSGSKQRWSIGSGATLELIAGKQHFIDERLIAMINQSQKEYTFIEALRVRRK